MSDVSYQMVPVDRRKRLNLLNESNENVIILDLQVILSYHNMS